MSHWKWQNQATNDLEASCYWVISTELQVTIYTLEGKSNDHQQTAINVISYNDDLSEKKCNGYNSTWIIKEMTKVSDWI